MAASSSGGSPGSKSKAGERRGGTIRSKLPKGITSDMYKPYIFGNNQKMFKLFNVAVCVGMCG
jgi:hypothetical protein